LVSILITGRYWNIVSWYHRSITILLLLLRMGWSPFFSWYYYESLRITRRRRLTHDTMNDTMNDTMTLNVQRMQPVRLSDRHDHRSLTLSTIIAVWLSVTIIAVWLSDRHDHRGSSRGPSPTTFHLTLRSWHNGSGLNQNHWITEWESLSHWMRIIESLNENHWITEWEPYSHWMRMRVIQSQWLSLPWLASSSSCVAFFVFNAVFRCFSFWWLKSDFDKIDCWGKTERWFSS